MDGPNGRKHGTGSCIITERIEDREQGYKLNGPKAPQENGGIMNYTLSLMLNTPLMYWRSRQGFMVMLALFRLASIAAVAIRFLTQRNLNGLIYDWFAVPYLIIAMILLFTAYLHPKYIQIDNYFFYGAVVLIDIVAINGFLYRSDHIESEIYSL